MSARPLRLVLAVLVLFLCAPPASGQGIATDPRSAEVTREELQQIMARLEEAAASSAYSAPLRAQARAQSEFIRVRLEQGDFQVGDRVVLRVLGRDQLTDTLSVQPGRVLVVGGIGEIPLEGVLRSELQEYLETQLSQYLADPVVRANSLIRLGILGAVNRQGFYAVPSEALIEETIMIAGGPAAEANLSKMEIRRGGRVLYAGEALDQAMVDGRTLDQLNLRAGDRIVVPREERGLFSGGVVRGLLTLTPTVLLLITRVF